MQEVESNGISEEQRDAQGDEQHDVHNDEQSEQSVRRNRKPEKSPVREFVDWAMTLGIAIVLALFIRHFLFAIFIVDGESMYPTLKDSEWLIVNKAIYFIDEPQKGEIVVFHATETRDYIKRVIAVAGDEIEIDAGELYVNGELIDEPYINEPMEFYNHYEKSVVPEHTIFVMGDNRNRSADSRMHDIGFIDIDRVVGRADFVFWPIGEMTKIH